MSISIATEGKKFMWDGIEYRDENEAKATVEKYTSEGFEAMMIKEDKYLEFTRSSWYESTYKWDVKGEKYLVFTRRVIVQGAVAERTY